MNKTIILGRDSYLSKYLKVSIVNSKTYSLSYKNLSKIDFMLQKVYYRYTTIKYYI